MKLAIKVNNKEEFQKVQENIFKWSKTFQWYSNKLATQVSQDFKDRFIQDVGFYPCYPCYICLDFTNKTMMHSYANKRTLQSRKYIFFPHTFDLIHFNFNSEQICSYLAKNSYIAFKKEKQFEKEYGDDWEDKSPNWVVEMRPLFGKVIPFAYYLDIFKKIFECADIEFDYIHFYLGHWGIENTSGDKNYSYSYANWMIDILPKSKKIEEVYEIEEIEESLLIDRKKIRQDNIINIPNIKLK
ncbi:MAG: hypothetical protein PVI88_00175 [Nitrosopumilaceae archaeon]|jgi:hypothetical protein